jgi:hypothetical protein
LDLIDINVAATVMVAALDAQTPIDVHPSILPEQPTEDSGRAFKISSGAGYHHWVF